MLFPGVAAAAATGAGSRWPFCPCATALLDTRRVTAVSTEGTRNTGPLMVTPHVSRLSRRRALIAEATTYAHGDPSFNARQRGSIRAAPPYLHLLIGQPPADRGLQEWLDGTRAHHPESRLRYPRQRVLRPVASAACALDGDATEYRLHGQFQP